MPQNVPTPPFRKPNQMLEKKLQSLSNHLNPKPFKPQKLLDFSKHEDLFRKLGLWDFVNIVFDTNMRKDLLVQLLASYDSHCSYVNGHLIRISKSDFARAFNIPLNVNVDDRIEPVSKCVSVFVTQFVLHWLLLQDDDSMAPVEVMNWINVLRDGYVEKVDWAGMIWFMVEKELVQGEDLRDCYFASHLQYLMKEQGVFSREEAGEEAKEVGGVGEDGEREEGNTESGIVELDDLEKGDDEVGVNERDQGLMDGNSDIGDCFLQRCGVETGQELGEKNSSIGIKETGFEGNQEAEDEFNVYSNYGLVEEGINGILGFDEEKKEVDGGSEGNEKVDDTVKFGFAVALGLDNEKKEGNKESNNMDFDDLRKKTKEDGVNKQDMDEKLENWKFFSMFTDGEDHFSQRRGSENSRELVENSKFGTEETEFEENGKSMDKVDRLTCNYLQTTEANQITIKSGKPDTQQMGLRSSFSYFSGNMAMEHEDNVMFRHSRTDDPIGKNDYGTCLDNALQSMKQAGILYQKKENALQQSHMHTQILLDEVQQRDIEIEHLKRSRFEEMQKRDNDICHYKIEVMLMKKVLVGYRNAMKDKNRVLKECRKKAQDTENVLKQSHMHTEALLNEVQKRDTEIELLNKSRHEEMQKRDTAIELLQKSILLLK